MDGPFTVAATLVMVVQVAQASVSGTVRDGAVDRPIAGAYVALADPGQTVVTDPEGRYLLTRISPGPHHIRVRAVGYSERTVHALVPASGALEIHVALQPEPIRLDGLEVRPTPPIRGLELETSPSFPERSMSTAAIRNHPLLSEPDALMALAGGEVLVAPESPDGLHVRGGSSDQLVFLLDGFPVFSPYHVAGTFGAWNPDALARVALVSAAPSAELPSALSGVVLAETKPVGGDLEARGGLSTTQARATASRRVGESGAGFLVSLRSGFPGFFTPPAESSYLRSEATDLIAKVEAPVMGGRLRVLGYGTENEVDAAAAGSEAGANLSTDRHGFGWKGVSIGTEWSRTSPNTVLRFRAWRASLDASARWSESDVGTSTLRSERRDLGAEVTWDRASAIGSILTGLRLERMGTVFRLDPSLPPPSSGSGATELPVVAGFVQVGRSFGTAVAIDGGLNVTRAAGALRVGPRSHLAWNPAAGWSLSGSWARLHQHVQSARNSESVVRTVFPPDLWVGAGQAGVPVARSDQIVLAVEHRPAPGIRLSTQAYRRETKGLALVAPHTGSPFSRGEYAIGRGTGRGLSFDVSLGGARYAALANYGWQDVRLDYAEGGFTPEYGSSHSLEAGIVVFPGTTYSVRAGVTGLFGRRGTALVGPLEWESCNLVDLGCEFQGSPVHGTEALGGVRLPAYLRLDVGARKHWHVGVRGRDVLLELHGTITNLFGRRNVLAFASVPETGAWEGIEMRPRAPLVLGLDWRF